MALDGDHGYLKSVLHALEIPVESQSLVFSKTSLQVRRISPRTPLAIYFSDDVYVGFCQSAGVLEVSAVDPQPGTVFCILDQRGAATTPKFERRIDNCLICHSAARMGVPKSRQLARWLLPTSRASMGPERGSSGKPGSNQCHRPA